MSLPVSILICTRNRVDALRETLASVGRLVVPPGVEPELIVVDNGSTDGTADYVRGLTLPNMPLRLVHEPRRGASFARNAALHAAQGDILFFADDDVRLPPEWIGALSRPLRNGTADAVISKVVLAPHLLRPWMEPFHRAALAATEAIDADDPQDLFTASMAFSRAVLDDVPGFDTELSPGRLGTMEDTLFSRQLRQAGFRLGTVFDVVVEHHFDESRLSRRAFLQAARSRGQSLTYIRYHWYHLPASAWTHRRHRWQVWRTPRLVLLKRLLHLAALRLLRRRDCRRAEGIAKWEFYALINIHHMRQYLKERRRPPNYARLGLVRLDAGPRLQPACPDLP